MRAILRTPRRLAGGNPFHAIRLDLEALECRTLPTTNALSGPLSAVLESEPNDTIDQAQSLGDLSTLQQVKVNGTVGRGTSGTADVDWYRFTLDSPSAITVATPPGQLRNRLGSVLSLYGSSIQNANGLAGHAGYRLIAQNDGADHDGTALLHRPLAAGTYFVAVSGSGNRYFHPLIAGSGYPGGSGDYQLVITATDLSLRSTDGPAVLAADPTAGADLSRSPFVIRIDFSSALDADFIRLGSNVQLSYTAGTPIHGSPVLVPLASSSFDATGNELQLTPAAPLRRGNYELFLGGDRSAHQQVLQNPTGSPLGKSDLHPTGNDFRMSFQISGIKGNRTSGAGADDIPATAPTLGELAGAGLVQIAGAIGDDPTDPIPFNPADVDLYHFHLRGTGRFALVAEVFAGRINSALDPALSLFRLGASDHHLHFVASNDNSFNPTVTHDGAAEPLFTDPILNAGLTEGSYYLAVSASGNVPMPSFGRLPGAGGIFDPNVSHSGKNGSTIGDYVLNVAAEPMNDAPHVSAAPSMDGTSLNQGALLTAPPTSLSVIFDKTVNLRQLVRQTGLPILGAVYIQSSRGTKLFPHLVDYTESGNRAGFLMHDVLPNGDYQLHLSGRQGLADLAGNPLVGNDPSGDYVIHFTVNGPARGSNGNPRVWLDQEPNDDPAHPQDLGVLFPAELQTGVILERGSPVAGASDTADHYQFRVLQHSLYLFGLNGSIGTSEILLGVRDASGKSIPIAPSRSGGFVHAAVDLEPGTYVVSVSGWSAAVAANVTYRLNVLSFEADQEQAPPLAIGPGPAIRIRPSTGGPPVLADLQVSTTIISGAGATPSGSHDLGAIPSGVLLLLAAGPVGGPSGTSPAPRPGDRYENILARAPDVLFSEVIARLPLLISPQNSRTAEGAAESGELLQWFQAVLNQIEKLNWSQALDVFYGSREWQERTRIRPANVLPDEMPESNVPDDKPVDKEEPPKSADWDDLNGEEIFEEAASPALAMAAALAARTPRERGRRHGLRRVRR